jgi:hypothetical protein
VLGRVADRCGDERLLSSTQARYGESVPVPEPPGRDDLVFARVYGAAPAGIEAVRTFLYQPPLRHIVFDRLAAWRTVPGLLSNGVVLGVPRLADFPEPFALAPNPELVAIRKDPAVLSPNRSLQFDFYAMRIRPSG